MSGHPVFQVLQRTLDVFTRTGVDCAVMGGFAVRHWALPRPTYDVDFAVAVQGEELMRLLHAFEEAGFSVPAEFLSGFADTLAGMRKVNLGCVESSSVWRVDLFLANTAFVRSAFDRRVPSTLEGRAVPVVSAEDLLLFKLLANRTKDRADVEDLLLVVGPLDHGYLRDWATKLGVETLLEDALRASGRL